MTLNDQHKTSDSILYIWLDSSIRFRKSNRRTANDIRKIVGDHLQTFSDPNKCVDYMTSEVSTQKIYLIISNQLGMYVVPWIYELPQIDTIYVYCRNKSAAETWGKANEKVRGIFIRKSLLLAQIRHDIHKYTVDDIIPISALHLHEQGNSLQKLSSDNAKFMWYRFAMHVLPRMAKYFNSKEEMIDEARKQYHDDIFENARIDKFAQTYQSDKAFWWYTSDSFVYRLLNRALRTQDIDIIFKFRFFINDLHNQIQQLYREYLVNHTGNSLTVYRGQFMSMDEIEFLKKNFQRIISMNTFLSTSQSIQVAKQFIKLDDQSADNPSEQSVLFTIDIRNINDDTTPFAFIERYACNQDEHEVLFTINGIFKVESVEKQGHIWHVHLQLNQQQNKDQLGFSKYLIETVESNPTPIVFGWFFYQMRDLEKAERHIQHIIEQPLLDDIDKAGAYNLLGLIYNDRKNYLISMEYYEKAINLYNASNVVDNSQMINIYYNFCLACLGARDYQLFENNQRKMEQLLDDSGITIDPLLVAFSSHLRAKIAEVCGEYSEALQSLDAVLERKKKRLHPSHPSIASTKHEIGLIHSKMGNDEEALSCFEEAVRISERSLLVDDSKLCEYHADIGRIQYKRGEYKIALRQFRKTLTYIKRSALESEDIKIEFRKRIKELKRTLQSSNVEQVYF